MFSTAQLSRLLSVLLATALVGLVAFWASRLLAPRPAIAPVNVANAAAAQTSSNWAGQLFGNAAAKVASGVAPAVDAQVQVLGVLTGDRPAAVLVVDGKPAKPFTIGQSVANGVVLKAIRPDSVTIERGGVPTKLSAPTRPNVAVLTAGPLKNNLPASGAQATLVQPLIQGNLNQNLPGQAVPPAFASPPPEVNPIGANPAVVIGGAPVIPNTQATQNGTSQTNGQSANSGSPPGSNMRGVGPPQ